MDRNEQREAISALISAQMPKLADGGNLPASASSDLSNALYAISEIGLWPDAVDSMSEQQALMAWAIVEISRKGKWNDALNM